MENSNRLLKRPILLEHRLNSRSRFLVVGGANLVNGRSHGSGKSRDYGMSRENGMNSAGRRNPGNRPEVLHHGSFSVFYWRSFSDF